MSNNSKSSGVGIGTVVQVVFIILKLTHLIDWSWFWVLSPTIFAVGIVLVIWGVLGIVAFLKSHF